MYRLRGCIRRRRAQAQLELVDAVNAAWMKSADRSRMLADLRTEARTGLRHVPIEERYPHLAGDLARIKEESIAARKQAKAEHSKGKR